MPVWKKAPICWNLNLSWPLRYDADFNFLLGQTPRKQQPSSVFIEPGTLSYTVSLPCSEMVKFSHTTKPLSPGWISTMSTADFLRFYSLWGFRVDREAENVSMCRRWCQYWLIWFILLWNSAKIRQITLEAATVLCHCHRRITPSGAAQASLQNAAV